MTDLPLEADPLPIRVDRASNGALRVGPTRMTLEVVLTAHLMGHRPEEIVQQFPSLDLADVYTVIGHYLRHREAFDRHLAEVERVYSERRARDLANGQAGLRERLQARRAVQPADDSTTVP